MTLGGFNWLDALVLLLLFSSLLVGYIQGVGKQLVGLVALYVGAILGAQYHTVVAGWYRMFLSELPSRFINGLAFFTIVIVVTSIVTVIALDAYQSMRFSVYPVADHLGGAVVSLFTIVLAITLCLPVLSFTTLEMWPTMEPARLFVDDGLRNSSMLVLFETLKPMMLSALSPWLPGGLPSIFNL
jgi:uncharacterized membrane protein required for colicin V production